VCVIGATGSLNRARRRLSQTRIARLRRSESGEGWESSDARWSAGQAVVASRGSGARAREGP
jgi:hypothetical protein